MSGIKLRPYQERSVVEIREALAKYRRVLFQSPTGSGKGVVVGTIASLSHQKGKRILIVCHRIEIVNQNIRQAQRMGIDCAIISPKQRKVPTEQAACAMVQTLQRRAQKEEWQQYLKSIDLLLIDEAHVSNFTWLFGYISESCFVVGFSATPCRMGNQPQLGLEYRAMVTGVSIKELIAQGYLCKCRLFSIDAPKMDDVEWDYARGDYKLGQMAKKFQSRAKYVGAVDNYERLINSKKTIIFCCSSEQTIEVTKAFNERGIKAKYLLSSSFDEDSEFSDERAKLLDDFAKGEYQVLVNLGCAVAGMDVPSIEAVILMYATTSVSKYLQSIGRAARIAPNKNGEFFCLDFGGNHERLGRYEDDRVWGIWHNTGAGGGVAPTKVCPQCGAMVAVMYQNCPFCGAHFPTKQEVYEAELHEIIEREDGEEETLEQNVARKKLAGWKNDWILRDLCQKNPDNQKQVFMQAIEVLRTQHGEKLSAQYWHFFRKYKLGSKKSEEKKDANLFGD